MRRSSRPRRTSACTSASDRCIRCRTPPPDYPSSVSCFYPSFLRYLSISFTPFARTTSVDSDGCDLQTSTIRLPHSRRIPRLPTPTPYAYLKFTIDARGHCLSSPHSATATRVTLAATYSTTNLSLTTTTVKHAQLLEARMSGCYTCTVAVLLPRPIDNCCNI